MRLRDYALTYLSKACDPLYRLGLEAVCLTILKRLPATGLRSRWFLRVYRLTRGIQTSASELQVIMRHVRQARAFLVFGLGRDTSMWMALGPENILFLEDNPHWIEHNLPFKDHTLLVTYGTRRRDYLELITQEDKLDMHLPDTMTQTPWDLILVDAPNGYEDHHPGRMKSIYMASKLIGQQGTVIVHDMDRAVEQTYAKQFLGTPAYRQHRLAVFTFPTAS